MSSQPVNKAKKKLGRGLLSRTFFFMVTLFLQVGLVVGVAMVLDQNFPLFYMFITLISVFAVLTTASSI